MEERWWSVRGQAMAGLMFLWALASKFLPTDLDTYLMKHAHRLWGCFRPYIDITFHEYSGERFRRSEAYATIQTYLSATTSKAAKRLTADIARNSSSLTLSLDEHEEVTDEFRGVWVWWTSGKVPSHSSVVMWYPGRDETRKFYKLTFHRAHQAAMDDYLKHVMEEGKAIEVRNWQRKLFTNSFGRDEGYYSDEKEQSKVTLSGLLNFIDGLWSTSCGGERLIVFTTSRSSTRR